ncbi:MAG TPA: NUDIX domain-containing protein [Pyrinomonadaceae bacterium]
MNFEPQKFFIGLIDFFAILLPGALLTLLVKDNVGPRLLGQAEYYKLVGTNGWVAFIFCGYLLGHFIFLIGSWLLDDHVYEPIKNANYGEQINRLAKGKRLSHLFFRWLSWGFFKKDSELALRQGVRIKDHYLDPLEASNAINAFQWSKARLTLEQPEAMATVQRFEADSKFFRSLVILCLIIVAFLVPLGLVENRRAIAWLFMALLPLALWRYKDQRLKATKQAYWYILTLEATVGSSLRQQPSQPNPDKPSHAGGVVFRKAKGRAEYLLVRAKENSQEWVLPKGHIELGESMKETAVREVREESGVWARVIRELVINDIVVKEKPIKIQFYLMEAVDGWLDKAISQAGFLFRRKVLRRKRTEMRERKWFPLDKARDNATHKESKELLELAGPKVSAI